MRAWIVEALLFLIYFAFGLSWFAFSPLRADIESFYQISKLEGGALFSSVSMAKSFVPFLAGFIVAGLGLKRSIQIGSLLCAVAMLVPFSPDYKTMLMLRFWFGVGGALVVTLMGPVVMQLFPREKLPFINGLNNVAVNTGIVTAFQLVPALHEGHGWQAILVGCGFFSLLLAVLWFFLGADAPAGAKNERASFSQVARCKETWLITLAFTGPLALYLALNSTLPDHFQLYFGLDSKAASSLTSLFNLVGIPSAILSGWITSKLGLRRPLIITAGIMMPLASLGLCFSPSQSLRLICAIGLGIALFLYVAPLFTIPMELPGSNAAFVARLNGIVFSGAYLLSGLSPMIVGFLFDQTQSYSLGLGFFCLSSCLLGLAGWFLPETGPAALKANQ